MYSFRVSVLILASLLLLPLNAGAWERGDVESFATLPAGSAGPEGITVDAQGNVYVTTFAVPPSGVGQLFVFDRHGNFLRQKSIAGSRATSEHSALKLPRANLRNRSF